MAYAFEIIEPSDYYTCIDTYFKEDFTQVCKFVLLDGDMDASNALSGKDLKLDMVTQRVTIPIGEHHKIDQHIGDTFSVHYYGRAPLVVNLQGVLIDSTDSYGKPHLIQLYRDVLRVKAVARSGIAPVVVFPGIAIQGAVTGMTITEDSETQVGILVSINMLVLRLLGNAPDNEGTKSVMYDYTIGADMLEEREQASTDTTKADAVGVNGEVDSADMMSSIENSPMASDSTVLATSGAPVTDTLGPSTPTAPPVQAAVAKAQTQATPAAVRSEAEARAAFVTAPNPNLNKYDKARQDEWMGMISGKSA